MLLISLISVGTLSCTRTDPPLDTDVIVVGAGIAGLSAALEAAATGVRVLVIDANSVGGGHAVKAGGLAMVDTALQQERGIEDTPSLALGDLLAWGEDPDIYWAHRYTQQSGSEVYDWLTELGVEFTMLLDAPDHSVPRFHFTRGTAVNVVVPMLRRALQSSNIDWAWNYRVTALAKSGGRITGVSAENLRDQRRRLFRAHNVILATGGFQTNLTQVRAHWPTNRPQPDRLLAGAGTYATGDGYRLAAWAGAELRDMNRQEIFHNGIPDPRDADGQRGLFAQNPASIWVDASGRRFVNEAADSKAVTTALHASGQAHYWLIFDAAGARRMNVRDASWLNSDTIRREILENPAITVTASSLEELAMRSGLPARSLQATAQTWNRMVEVGEDFRFGRFGPGNPPRSVRPLGEAPFYAVRMSPLTRKSMGGPVIDARARALNTSGTAVPGLYAAGELTGVAGINGSYGGAGTFLGPGVLTGRIAGRAAGEEALARGISGNYRAQILSARGLSLATLDKPGYWHYSAVHQRVQTLGYACESCHADPDSMRPGTDQSSMLARLDTCTTCH